MKEHTRFIFHFFHLKFYLDRSSNGFNSNYYRQTKFDWNIEIICLLQTIIKVDSLERIKELLRYQFLHRT